MGDASIRAAHDAVGVNPFLARGPHPVNLRRDARVFQQTIVRPCYLAGIDRASERTVKHTILGRRLDLFGHDACQLMAVGDGWRLSGMAVFNLDGRPCALSYEVDADARWSSRGARVHGWCGTERVDVAIVAALGGGWCLNGAEQSAGRGCVD